MTDTNCVSSIRKKIFSFFVPSLFVLLALFSQSTFATQQADPKLRTLLIEAINQSESFADRFDAEVWLVDMSRRLQDFIDSKKQRLELLRLVHSEASRAHLQPELVLAVIEVESRFDSYAISRSGASARRKSFFSISR